MVQVLVRFEVINDYTSDRLLELLCQAIHEGNQDSIDILCKNVVDIEVLGKMVVPH